MSVLTQFLRQLNTIGYDNSSSSLTATNGQAAIDELDTTLDEAVADIGDIRTLTGTADESTDLGTFTGSTISDTNTIKGALQELETAHEEVDQNVNDLITLTGVAENATDLGTFSGSTIADSLTIKAALQSLETAHESLSAINIEWQDSALDYVVDNTAVPASEVSGDRYILSHDGGAPHANYDGASAGDIVEFNGSIWVATTPTTGTFISADDEADRLYNWGGSSWAVKLFEATTASTGLTKVGVDIQLDSSAAGAGLGFAAGVLSVNVDDSTIEINTDTLRVKADGINDTHIDFGTGVNQVSAADLPIADGGGLITATDVEGALAENRTAIDAIEDNTITSTNGSLTSAGTVGGDDQVLEVAFSSTGATNRAVQSSDLASTSASLGASMVGIQDVGSLIVATTVEGALAEIAGGVGAIIDNTITSPNGSIAVAGNIGGDNQTVDVEFSTAGASNRSIEASALASSTNGEGASMVGIEDVGTLITATTVEGALAENRTAIDAIEDNTLTSPNGSLSVAGTVGADNQTADVVFSTAGAANRSIEASSLAATTSGLGASLVGIEDSGTIITATTVEGALIENRTAIDAIEDNTIAGGTGITSTGTVGADDQNVAIDLNSSVTFGGSANWIFTADTLSVSGTVTGGNSVPNKAYVDALTAGSFVWIDPVFYIDLVADDYGAGTHIKDLQTPTNSTVDIEDSDMVIADVASATYRAVGTTGNISNTVAAAAGQVLRFEDDAANGGLNPTWEDLGHLSSDADFPDGTRWGVSIDSDVNPSGTFANRRGAIMELTSNGTAGNYDATWAVASEMSGTGTSEVTAVTTPAASTFTSSGAGDYFIFETEATEFYVWFDVDNGNTDPAPISSIGGAKTSVEVDVASGDTASQVATKLQTALNALTGVTGAAPVGATFDLTVDADAAVPDAEDIDSGVTFAVSTQGIYTTGPQNTHTFVVNNTESQNAFRQYTYNADNGRWINVGATAAITDGVGLTFTGNVLNINLGAGIVELPNDEVGIDLATDGGLELTSLLTGGQLQAKVDDSTIETTASGLQVKSDGINDTHIDFGTGANQVSAGDLPILDSGALITATDVEGALAENRTAIDAIEDNTITSTNGSISTSGTIGGDNQDIDVVFSTTGAANRSIEAQALASAVNGEGASMVGIEDSAGNFTATDVEGALTEIDGRLDTLESGGTLDWIIKVALHTAADGEKILANSSGGAFTINLPVSPSAGDEVVIRDALRTSESNAITVGRNSENIGGLAEDLTINVAGAEVHLVYVNAGHGWSVTAA